MQPESIVDDTLKDVQRFRILCVGRSGVGKSSLINRVFRLEKSPNAAPVAQYMPGTAEIDKEFTSPENNYFILHDSKGFESGDTDTYNDVERFIRERSNSKHLKDQLHAVWLCTETPRAGGRIFETGDENLLRLAHDTGTPVVIVFTKYDKLVRTKRAELQEDGGNLSEDRLHEKSKEGAQKALDVCIQSLQRTLRDMKLPESQTPKPHHVNVSHRQGYEATISSLVQVTCDLVSDKLKLMWAIAQRASREVKINACIDITMSYLTIPPDHGVSSAPSFWWLPLHKCLGWIHQDIITCWNFRDEEKTLISEGFKHLMLYLAQDVQETQNQGGPHVTPHLAIDKISTFVSLITDPSSPSAPTTDVIGLTSPFNDWLSDAVLDNQPPVQRFLMTYTTDLTTVLKSLFDTAKPSFSEGTMWSELNKVFQAYERLDPREQIHRRICASFQPDQQITDPASFRGGLLRDLLLEREPLPSGPERSKTGGRNAQDTRAPRASSSRTKEPSSPPGVPTPSPEVTASSPRVHAPSPGESAPSPGRPAPPSGVPPSSLVGASPSPGGAAPPPRSPEGAPSPTKPPIWHRLFPCLAPPA